MSCEGGWEIYLWVQEPHAGSQQSMALRPYQQQLLSHTLPQQPDNIYAHLSLLQNTHTFLFIPKIHIHDRYAFMLMPNYICVDQSTYSLLIFL